MVTGRIIRSHDLPGESGTISVPARTLPSTNTGDHYIQVARTLPQFHFKSIKPHFGTEPMSFAPNGIFEVKVTWQKAIANATEYIYIEDQSFWSHDVMDWLNERVKKNNTVKVILLTGALIPPIHPTMARWLKRSTTTF